MDSFTDILRDSVSILSTSNNLTVYIVLLFIGRRSVLTDMFRMAASNIISC